MNVDESKPVEALMYCHRCNRQLKSEKSRKKGYGPFCDKKRLIEGTQLTIEGALEHDSVG